MVPSSMETLCDLWEAEPPVHLSHSRLYHLEPIGLGSPIVESLTSYLMRLADAHSVHPRLLIVDEILPHLKHSYLYQNGQLTHLSPLWRSSARLNGVNHSTQDWVQAVEQGTLRRDLRFLTMLSFADVLSPNDLVRFLRTWCPICLEEWREANQIVYEPLIWCLEMVRVCPIHDCLLQTRCPNAHCQRSSHVLAPRTLPGYCSHCQSWLGTSQVQALVPPEEDQQRLVASMVGELLAATPSMPVLPSRNMLSTLVTAYLESQAEGKWYRASQQLQISRRTLQELQQGTRFSTLDTIVQLCLRFGTTPLGMFTRTAEAMSAIQRLVPPEMPREKKPKKLYRKFDVASLRSALETTLQQSNDPPPSMREVAHRLGYDEPTMYRHLPDLCKAIAARYRVYRSAQKSTKLQAVCDEVKQLVYALHEQGRYPSLRQVRLALTIPARLKEREVYLTWYEALRELGYKQ